MRKLIIGWLLVIGIVSVGRACEHCAALAVGNVVPAKVKYFLTSSLRTPKIFVKEFSYFLMPCHQHGLRINLLVQR